ncbi:MAG: permease, partial [Paludibacteraceae bacterium]|nr:permease [Paludibacteraceae bacterium]
MNEIIALINQMSPYLLLGFLFSGILHAFVPQGVYNKYLSGNDFKSVFYATLFGIPLPLCSCGVIPTAMSLRKEGASKGATTAFLIATPQTGIDSIAATYSILGPAFAVIRPVAALFTALFGGLFVNAVSKNEKDNMVAADECKGDCCTAKNEKRSFSQKIVEALKYAFVDMMGDIGKWLVIGLVIAGLI